MAYSTMFTTAVLLFVLPFFGPTIGTDVAKETKIDEAVTNGIVGNETVANEAEAIHMTAVTPLLFNGTFTMESSDGTFNDSLDSGNNTGNGGAVLRPTNTIVVAGQTLFLPCSSVAVDDSRWDFYRHDSRRLVSLYNGKSFDENAGRRMDVDHNTCRQRFCNLTISTVQNEDAGFYVCFESSRHGRRNAAAVVVLAAEPQCSINQSFHEPGVVYRSDMIEINCSVDFKGSWVPQFNCTPEIQGQAVNQTSSESRVTYLSVFSADDVEHCTVITCTMNFTFAEWDEPDWNQIDSLNDTPHYNFTWDTGPIGVFDTTELEWPESWNKTCRTQFRRPAAATVIPAVTTDHTRQWNVTVIEAGPESSMASFISSSMTTILLVSILVICLLIITVLVIWRCRRARARHKAEDEGGGRALPPIPTSTGTSTLTSIEGQHQTSFQTAISTAFEDDGHYTDIHTIVMRAGGTGGDGIPTWRRSFVDEPGHYNYLEFRRQADQIAEEQQRRPPGYEGLDPAEIAILRQPPPPHQYTGIGGDQPRPTETSDGQRDAAGNSENVDGTNGNWTNEEQTDTQELSSSRSADLNQGRGGRQGYEGLDPVAAEVLRRPQRAHSYAGMESTSPVVRAGVHSYLEILGHAGSGSEGDIGKTAQGYEGLDPAEVKESMERRRKPNDYAELRNGSNASSSPGGVVENSRYEGLDQVAVEQGRREGSRPREYIRLNDDVDDLYSKPVKKR